MNYKEEYNVDDAFGIIITSTLHSTISTFTSKSCSLNHKTSMNRIINIKF